MSPKFIFIPSASQQLWTPIELGAAVVRWFDASDASTITEVSGSVSQWDDKSALAANLTQGSGALQPSYANSLVTFNDDLIDNTVDQVPGLSDPTLNSSIYTVSKSTASDYAGFVICLSSTFGRSWFNDTRTGVTKRIEEVSVTPQVFLDLTDVVPDNVFQMIGSVSDTVNITGYLNGNTQTSMPVFVTSDINNGFGFGQQRIDIGSNLFFIGDVGESVVTNTALSVSDRQKLEGYLAWKWDGINSNTDLVDELPIGHPYKLSPPTV